jgi:hypothetical protein
MLDSRSAGFYSAGTYASLQSSTIEELFAGYVPGGETCIEWAEDKGLDKVGAGEVAGCVRPRSQPQARPLPVKIV